MAPRHAVDNDDVPMVERAPHQGPDSVPVLLPAVGVGDGEVLHVGPGQGNTLPLSQPLRETNHLEATCREGCRRDRRRDARQEEGSSFHVVVDQGWDLGGFPPDGCQPIPFAVSRVQAQALPRNCPGPQLALLGAGCPPKRGPRRSPHPRWPPPGRLLPPPEAPRQTVWRT